MSAEKKPWVTPTLRRLGAPPKAGLIGRLRTVNEQWAHEAADEIERLQSELDLMRKAVLLKLAHTS